MENHRNNQENALGPLRAALQGMLGGHRNLVYGLIVAALIGGAIYFGADEAEPPGKAGLGAQSNPSAAAPAPATRPSGDAGKETTMDIRWQGNPPPALPPGSVSESMRQIGSLPETDRSFQGLQQAPGTEGGAGSDLGSVSGLASGPEGEKTETPEPAQGAAAVWPPETAPAQAAGSAPDSRTGAASPAVPATPAASAAPAAAAKSAAPAAKPAEKRKAAAPSQAKPNPLTLRQAINKVSRESDKKAAAKRPARPAAAPARDDAAPSRRYTPGRESRIVYLQTGTFATAAAANRQRDLLAQKNIAVEVVEISVEGRRQYRVRTSPVPYGEARNMKNFLKNENIPSIITTH